MQSGIATHRSNLHPEVTRVRHLLFLDLQTRLREFARVAKRRGEAVATAAAADAVSPASVTPRTDLYTQRWSGTV